MAILDKEKVANIDSDFTDKIIAILSAEPEKWFDQVILADKMGKKRLNPLDVQRVRLMAERDLIDARRSVGAVRQHWEYRARQNTE